MLFNSFEFIFGYLPIVVIGFFCIARFKYTKIATCWLVVASFFFYGYWDVRYIPLLLLSITFNFLIGRRIEETKNKKVWLILGICGNLVLLGYFKYTGFFLQSLNSLIGAPYQTPNIVLPLGISFYTFTQTAYLIDAYRGETKRYSFLTYCLFVTIFPHLIAGPIINHHDMIPQFSRIRNFVLDYRNLGLGIIFFTIGLFKKVVIADKLSPWVAIVFSNVEKATTVDAWLGALAYTFQLYFDFSGYSEMAIGLGLMLNLHFPVNFDSPYQAKSIIDFWRRWHMTLGLWVKNYLYIPMGGNRNGQLHKMRNLLVSMLLIGLWHGAGWTFVLWGGIHGTLLLVNHQWRRLGIHLPSLICWCTTFLCVTCAWVLFRATSLNDGLLLLHKMLVPGVLSYTSGVGLPLRLITIYVAILGLILAICPSVVHWVPKLRMNWLVVMLILATLLFTFTRILFNDASEFLYFQF